jgi:hypothetical protein
MTTLLSAKAGPLATLTPALRNRRATGLVVGEI